jgi:hypothetical protein
MRRPASNAPALAARVRNAISKRPERLNQANWLANVWFDNVWDLDPVSAESLRAVLGSEIPPSQAGQNPIWGATACVGGLAAILAAPTGSVISFAHQTITLPGGTYSIRDYARFELDLRAPDAYHYLFQPTRTPEEIDAALAVIADRVVGWPGEPLWSLTHARLGRPVAERPGV